MRSETSSDNTQTLDVERLFSGPALTGELPSHIKFSPNGDYIAWLQVAKDNRERLDLWLYETESKTKTLILDATVAGQSGILSDAEKAERERRRQFTTGVTNFHWHPTSELIAAEIDGAVYLLRPKSAELKLATSPGTRQTHLKFSPDGAYLAFVRNYNLWLYDLEHAREQQFTHGGTDVTHYGLPEFIAQEEMHRFDGYWWSDDSQKLIYTRVDNSTVAISQRYEIDAEQFRVIEQRYPYAGATDAKVDLAVHALGTQQPHWIEWRDNSDDYLARVNCYSGDVYVQVQTRSQQTLTLKRWSLSATDSKPVVLLSESSTTWINLHDNFKPLSDSSFLWTSARLGYEHLYLYSQDTAGSESPPTGRALTTGDSVVTQVLHADKNHVLFCGWQQEPTEQHLYRCSLSDDSPAIEALTEGKGWHDFSFADSGRIWVDRHSNFSLPAELCLGELGDNGSVTHTPIASLEIDANHPYQPFLAAHSTPTMGSISQTDGETLYYRLTEPTQRTPGKRYPVVVYVYGGPGGARVNWAWPPLLLQLFANQGFGVFELDNRGTGNRSKAFDDAIYLHLGEVEVQDQLRGVDYLKSLDWVDADRLGVFGHSYGGYMTVMCMAKANTTFKAGVSVAPVSQWELYDTHYTERYLGTPKTNPEGYEASSVFPYLKHLQGDLLLIHGMADDNVLFTHSTKLYKALQDQGIPFQMMTYPGSKHALHERSVSIHRFEALFKFFSEKLNTD